jgi:hypothetical protein
MKVLLKLSLLVLFVAATINADAQKYAIEAGYTNPMRFGKSVGTTFFYGGKIGVTARYSLKANPNASFLTGVLYSLVYADRQSGYPNSEMATYKTTGHFIDIPLQAIYSLPISKNMSFFGYAGPTINIGLAQNMKVTSTLTYSTASPFYVKPGSFNVYNSGAGDYQLNRLNLQIGVGGGIQWKKYQLKSGYDFGITNLNKADTGNLFQKGWYVSFSYQF